MNGASRLDTLAQASRSGARSARPAAPTGGTLMAFLDPDPAVDRILIMGVARPVPGEIPELDLSPAPQWRWHDVEGTIPAAIAWLAGRPTRDGAGCWYSGSVWSPTRRGPRVRGRIAMDADRHGECAPRRAGEGRRLRCAARSAPSAGVDQAGDLESDLGAASSWTRIVSGGSPYPGYGSTVVLDERHDRLIALGNNSSGAEFRMDAAARESRRLGARPRGGRQPANRGVRIRCIDGQRDRILVFGGSDGTVYRDAWFLQLSPSGDGGRLGGPLRGRRRLVPANARKTRSRRRWPTPRLGIRAAPGGLGHGGIRAKSPPG